MMKQTAAFLLYQSREFAWSDLLCGQFRDPFADRRKQNGGNMSPMYKGRRATAEPGGRL